MMNGFKFNTLHTANVVYVLPVPVSDISNYVLCIS